MNVTLHPHALERAAERGAEPGEVLATVERGEASPAKHQRTVFRRNFPGPWTRRGKTFDTKQIEAYAAPEADGWIVITVIVRYF